MYNTPVVCPAPNKMDPVIPEYPPYDVAVMVPLAFTEPHVNGAFMITELLVFPVFPK